MGLIHARSRGISLSIFCLAFILTISTHAFSQTPLSSPSPTPEPSNNRSEKHLIRDILSDQKAIWTAPFHLNRGDAAWVIPLTGATATLFATDTRTSGELVENGDNLNRLRISRYVSQLGAYYTTGGIAGAFYLTGRVTHNAHARETGLLAAEALIDGAIVGGVLKVASQRPRPSVDDSSGEFFDRGSSFPSGHAISAWSLATIVAQEYGQHRPVVKIGAYALASAVSISRYTGGKHFLSDVLVGSAIGYGIGRYVYERHHDQTLDFENKRKVSKLLQSELFPRIVPEYSPRTQTYGARLAWNF
jgi:membrane-associated phospholipid phosphatase